MSEQTGLSNLRQQTLAHILIALMAVSILAPMAAAAGMTSCDKDPGVAVDGICDTYDDSDDGTPNMQDWIEGTYEFTMLGTEQIQLVAEVLPKEMPLTVLTSQNRVAENLIGSGIECTLLDESLTSQGLNVLTQMHDLVLQAIGEGRLSRGERLLVVLAEPIIISKECSITSLLEPTSQALVLKSHGFRIGPSQKAKA